jgi:hypothetical protein
MRESLRAQSQPPPFSSEGRTHTPAEKSNHLARDLRMLHASKPAEMIHPTSPEPSQSVKEQKKSQSKDGSLLKKTKAKTKNMFRGSEHKEESPDYIRTASQCSPPQTQSAPRKQSMQANTQIVPTKQREIGKGDNIATLNREAIGIERQWSMGITEDRADDPQPRAPKHPDVKPPSTTVTRRAMNGQHNQKSLASVSGPNHLGPSAIPVQNASLTSLRTSHAAYEVAQLHFDDSALVPNRSNGPSVPILPHEPRSAQQLYNGTESNNHKVLNDELGVVQERNKSLQEQLQVAREDLAHVQHLDRDHRALLSEHEQVLQDVANLQAERDHAANETVQLAQANAGLLEDVETWHSRFNLVNKELLEARADISSGSKVDDKWFAMQWGDLQVKIESLSHQYFLGHLSRPGNSILDRAKGSRPEKMESQPSKAITRLTNSFARYLKSDQDRPLLIQAFLWCILVNNVFDHAGYHDGGFYWAGQSRSLLYHLRLEVKPIRPRRHKDAPPYTPSDEQRMEKETKDYHKWRAEMAVMMLAREPVTKRIRNISGDLVSLIAEVVDELAPYVVVSKDRPLAAIEPDLKDQLRIILTAAIETDAEIARQRARIFCEQWRGGIDSEPFWGFPVDPDDTETISTPDQTKGGIKTLMNPVVELIVQPALFREGNQYGEEYDVKRVLSKARVVVGENLALPSGRRW